MTLRIQSTFMLHSSGTKFYEAVLVTGESAGYLVKRWGKENLRRGGGDTLVVTGTPGEAAKEYASIVAAKQKRGYAPDTSMNGYGMHMGAKSGAQGFHDTVYGWSASHYSDASITTAMRDLFGGDIPSATALPLAADNSHSSLNEGWGLF